MCSNNNGTGICMCNVGYTGTYCDSFQGCSAGGNYTCLNSGVCNTNTGTCQCPFGYSGTYCEAYIGCNAGVFLSCLNGGTCSSNGICKCPIGYSGSTCYNCNTVFHNFIKFN